MEQAGARRRLRLAFGIVGPVALVALAGLLVATRGSADGRTPPLDGRYENVVVEGRVVPMIHVKEGGAIVLVDTDGAKPRTWEEQFKRHGNLPNGTYDVHRTHQPGHGDSFADDPIDRVGVWTIDDRGNITEQR